jgi:RNA polymerase sigma-70 factor (ECF subfamily)
LQAADAEDVTQNVLLKPARRMKEFHYDRSQSFRAWIKTAAHHAWRDYVDGRQGRRARPDGGRVVELLHSIEAREDLAQRLEEQFDHELLERAMQGVRL